MKYESKIFTNNVARFYKKEWVGNSFDRSQIFNVGKKFLFSRNHIRED